MVRDTPGAGRSCGEKPQITCAKPLLFAFPIDHEGLSRDHYNGLILTEVPFKLPRGAIPYHDARGPDVASYELLTPCFRPAAQNPLGRDRLSFKLDRCCSSY